MDFIRKTLGGLKASYYIRHFVFGALISTFFIYMSMQNPGGVKVENIIFFFYQCVTLPLRKVCI